MHRKFDLQLFNEAVQGKKIVYLYRIKSKAATTDGTLLAFTTENGRSKSKDADSTATKDGSIRTPGTAETEISANSILSKGDTMIDSLEDAMDNDELIEIWEANLEEPAEGGEDKFKGMYFQGYLTSFDKTSSAEDFTEIELTFGINGSGKRGDVTVTTEQQELADYVFKDTPKESSSGK
jgi:TP901-1 family phage major tail protein